MDQIRRLAFVSVGRACGFAGLAIFTVMVGLSFEPEMATRSGAILFTVVAAVLRLYALRAPHRDPRHTEVWIMLQASEMPPLPVARQVIGRALAETYRRFSNWALVAGGVSCGASVLLALSA